MRREKGRRSIDVIVVMFLHIRVAGHCDEPKSDVMGVKKAVK